jgi:hypothetical protein
VTAFVPVMMPAPVPVVMPARRPSVIRLMAGLRRSSQPTYE